MTLFIGWLCVLSIPIIIVLAYFDLRSLKKKGIEELREHDVWAAEMNKLMGIDNLSVSKLNDEK